MTIGELKALVPLSDVYELNSESRYLMVAEAKQVTLEMIRAIGEQFGEQKVYMAIMLVRDTEGIKIMDLEAKQ